MKNIMFFLFAIFVLPLQAQLVQQAEYFFGSDPGYGNGTPIALTPGNLVEVDFAAGTQDLSFGVHLLSIRAKGNGTWGQTYTRIVGVSGTEAIYRAEYFFNTDPGYGNGTAIPVTPGNLTELNFDANTSNLSPGVHMMHIRILAGAWSQTFSRLIGVSGTEAIYRAEYFFNTDPGYGNGTAIPVTPGNLTELNFDASTEGLPDGIHILYVRLQAGAWSQTFNRVVGVSSGGISHAEYFIGQDPGYGQGIEVNNVSGNLAIMDFDVNMNGLPNGIYQMGFRAFSGAWSQTYFHEFCRAPLADFTADTVLAGNPTTFTNLSQRTDVSTQFWWDVDGDGEWDYFNGDDFMHLYDAPGSYMAKLKLLSAEGCADSIVHEVLVYACMAPTELFAENITYNSAELNWTPGNFGNQWDILYGLHDFDPETEGTLIEGVLEQPYFLSGLEDQTAYDFYVRTVCDETTVSEWSEPQQFTTAEYFCAPDWEVSPYYQFSMQVIAEIYIEDELSLDPNDKIGAFVDDECRGIAAPDPELSGLVFLSIGSNEISGETITFKIWDVDACEECAVAENLIFENQAQVGTPANPYPFECGMNELDLSFGEGYTWFSANINPGTMDPNDLFAGLQPCVDDRIIGQNSFSIYYDETWIGSLTEIIPGSMHKMELCSQQSLTIEGMPVENEALLLGEGYTWLGYLPQGQLSVDEALAPLNPAATEDDRLLAQNAFAVFYQGQWIGSLQNMNPGKGFIIELSQESMLTYPDAVKNDGEEIPPEEQFNPLDEMLLAYQQYTMMIIAQLELPNGTISQNPEDVVYAYSGTECRGIASPDPDHSGTVFMSVGSDQQEGEEITFKAWLSDYEMPVDIRETISFESLKKAGTMAQPELFTVKGFTGTGESFAEGIYIGEPHPNPFTNSTEITCHLTVPANLKLTVLNAQGQQMSTITDREFSAGNHSLVINRNDLPPGIYFFRLEITSNQGCTQKLGKLIIK